MNHDEFIKFWHEIVGITMDCSNKHYCFLPNPVGSEMHKRKNDLLYRCNSIFWHVGILQSLVDHIDYKAKNEKGDLIGMVYKEWDKVHYVFDDIIFNLISSFDYFASLVNIIMTNNKYEFKKWNSVLKKSRDGGYSFPHTESVIIEFHKSWVNKLSEYRANVYHEKSDKPSAIAQNDFYIDQREVEFRVTDKASKVFSIDKETELVKSVHMIIDKSLYKQRDILECCVEEKNNEVTHSNA